MLKFSVRLYVLILFSPSDSPTAAATSSAATTSSGAATSSASTSSAATSSAATSSAATSSGPDWRSVPLPEVDTNPRRRNVARLRAMGGDPTCVPPDFNNSMLAIWEDLWHSMHQSGKVGVAVHDLLRHYRERCTAERNLPGPSSASPPPLLPVSFAQAKDWLLRKQKAQSAALEFGAVSETARAVVDDLSCSLAEQPPATAALLQRPADPASPILLPPVLSLGAEPVTDQVRAEERQELRKGRAEGSGKQSSKSSSTGKKKKKTVSPEMEDQQQRASARMLELGIQPLPVRIFLY